MKVIVMATDSTSTWMLINYLKRYFPDVKVLLETPVSRRLLLMRRISRVGLFTVVGQVFFALYAVVLRRFSRKYIQGLMRASKLSSEIPVDISVKKVESVNSEVCKEWIVRESPDVVVVNGTRIIAKNILEASCVVFLNTHCGITPAYRGVHGGYWALLQGDLKNVGVTIHLVDPGVDTGGILYQATVGVDALDNFATYPVKQYIVALPLMRKALYDVADDNMTPYHRDDLPSNVWQHPTLWQYIKGCLLMRVF